MISHPLRPSGGRILVCEGEGDFQFLTAVLGERTPELMIYRADGKKNIGPLARILHPAVSIADRDFDLSEQQARVTFGSDKHKMFWSRHDMECYLLYTDWILLALETMRNTPKPPTNIPDSESVIEQDIIEVAGNLIIYHAGRKTISDLLRRNFQAGAPPGSAGEHFDAAQWENHIINEVARLRRGGVELADHPELDEQHVTERFGWNVQQYTDWANSLDTIRIEFSGKRILKRLTALWKITEDDPKRKVPILTDEIIKEVARYVESIPPGKLAGDPRLGDVGLLTEKVLGRAV